MGLADDIINLAFGLILGAIAVAFALAFGLGGREQAGQVVQRLLGKAEEEANKPASAETPTVTPTSLGATRDVDTQA